MVSNQLLYKAFFTDLTFNLYFKMYLLTSDFKLYCLKILNVCVSNLFCLVYGHPKNRVSYQMQLITGPNKAF